MVERRVDRQLAGQAGRRRRIESRLVRVRRRRRVAGRAQGPAGDGRQAGRAARLGRGDDDVRFDNHAGNESADDRQPEAIPGRTAVKEAAEETVATAAPATEMPVARKVRPDRRRRRSTEQAPPDSSTQNSTHGWGWWLGWGVSAGSIGTLGWVYRLAAAGPSTTGPRRLPESLRMSFWCVHAGRAPLELRALMTEKNHVRLARSLVVLSLWRSGRRWRSCRSAAGDGGAAGRGPSRPTIRTWWCKRPGNSSVPDNCARRKKCCGQA